MNLLKSKQFALLVMILLIAGSTWMGSYRSLHKLAQDVQETFSLGADKDGLSIQSDLDERFKQAYNLVTVAQKYLDANDEAIVRTMEARDALYQAKTPGEKYSANVELTEATTQLYEALGKRALSETDEKSRVKIFTNLTSRNDTISHDPYNQEAEAFNRKLEQFPANVLSGLTGVEPAQLFRPGR